jgi:hypothetical protein
MEYTIECKRCGCLFIPGWSGMTEVCAGCLEKENTELRSELDATENNMEALTELFDEVVKERDAQKQVRGDYAGIIHNMVVSLQSAWIEWQHGEGAEKAMIHIHNMLDGPGQIPDENDPYGKDSEMYYAANRHDPYPVCFCGKPSVIACGDKGYCCEEHFNQGEGE